MLSCDLNAAQQKAAELKHAFADAVQSATADLPSGIGLSVGFAEVVSSQDDVMERVREADRRMYEDKVAEK